MAPQVYDGMVIVGSSGGEWPIRGFVAAVDSKTGKEKWRWQATDPNTFEGDSWKSGGPASTRATGADRSSPVCGAPLPSTCSGTGSIT